MVFKTFLKIGILILLILVLYCLYHSYISTDIPAYLFKNSKYETRIYKVSGENKGKTLLVVSGIHGNEIAGIKASFKARDNKIKNGNLIIIPQINKNACENKVRNTYYMSDLNREFPGKENGTDTQKLAYEIMEFIENIKPDLVLDLHEWEVEKSDDTNELYGILTSYHDDKFYIDLDKLIKSKEKNIILENISMDNTLNKEVVEKYNIPVITVESDMDSKLSSRVSFHSEIIDWAIKYLGMDD